MSIESVDPTSSLWLADTKLAHPSLIGEIESRTADLLPFVDTLTYERNGRLTYQRQDTRAEGIVVKTEINTEAGNMDRTMSFRIPAPAGARQTRHGTVVLQDTSTKSKNMYSIHFKNCGDNPQASLALLQNNIIAADKSVSLLGSLAGFMPDYIPGFTTASDYGFTVTDRSDFDEVWAILHKDLDILNVPTQYKYSQAFQLDGKPVQIHAEDVIPEDRQRISKEDSLPQNAITLKQAGVFDFVLGTPAGYHSGFFTLHDVPEQPPLTEEETQKHPYRIEELGVHAGDAVYRIDKWTQDGWRQVQIYSGTLEGANEAADERYQNDLYQERASSLVTKERAVLVMHVLDRIFNQEVQRVFKAGS